MHTDRQVLRLRHLRYTDKLTLAAAANKSNMCEKSARKYLKSGRLPSETQVPRPWRTREDPFNDVWDEVEKILKIQPRLKAKTIFEDLENKYPERFLPGQLRTLQRKVKNWRLSQGQSKHVIFEQVHFPGVRCQSDFSSMNDLKITLNHQPFEHLLYHFVLTYSNWESVSICFSENFEALAEGLAKALKTLGGVPQTHQTDQLGAVKQIGKADFQRRYAHLMGHFGLVAETTNPYSPHENGDIEQAHHQLKRALDQALLLRGHRDFENMEAYEYFLNEVIQRQNAKRKVEEERARLKPLPTGTYSIKARQQVRVSKYSTIRVNKKTYSVDSRLIGEKVDVFVSSTTLEIWRG